MTRRSRIVLECLLYGRAKRRAHECEPVTAAAADAPDAAIGVVAQQLGVVAEVARPDDALIVDGRAVAHVAVAALFDEHQMRAGLRLQYGDHPRPLRDAPRRPRGDGQD